jgi:ectoine hydroxylase
MLDLYPSRQTGQSAIAPRHDPVVRSSDFAAGPITQGEVERYARDGFLLLDDVFAPDEVAALQAEADRMRQRGSGVAEETLIIEPGYEAFDPAAVRSVFAMHRQSPTFAALVAEPRLADIARFLLNDDVYIHQSRLNYKPAFRGKEFYWHSDFETWHTEDGMPRMRALSATVMLTENHPQAGPTMFMPGSHLSYVSCAGETPEEHYKSSLRRQQTGVPDSGILDAFARQGGVTAPAPRAGSVVIFDCNTIHGSGSNITPFARINAFFVFNAWSNRLVSPFGPTDPRPEFLAHRDVDAPLKRPDHGYSRAA